MQVSILFKPEKSFRTNTKRALAIAAVAIFGLAGCAALSGERPDPLSVSKWINLTAAFNAANVRPINRANKRDGGGSARLTYNQHTRELLWTVHYLPLQGQVLSIGFYGPASETEIGALQMALPVDAESPIAGKARLTEAQGQDILAGRWYISIQTKQFPAGDVRGQIMKGGSIGGT